MEGILGIILRQRIRVLKVVRRRLKHKVKRLKPKGVTSSSVNSNDNNSLTTSVEAQSTGATLESEIESLRRGGRDSKDWRNFRVKNIDKIEMGEHLVEVSGTFPQNSTRTNWLCFYLRMTEEEVRNEGGCIVYLCEFCLEAFGRRSAAYQTPQYTESVHLHPPGNEIYRSGSLSFSNWRATSRKLYCWRLCFVVEVVSGSQDLFYDVDPFLF